MVLLNLWWILVDSVDFIMVLLLSYVNLVDSADFVMFFDNLLMAVS